MIFKSVLGIYVGKKRFSAVWLKGTFAGVRSEFHLTAEFEKEQSVREKCDKAASLIREYIQENKMGPVDVRLGLDKELVILKRLQFPTAVKDDLKSTLTYEIERYIPLSVDEIVFDYSICGIDKKRKQLNVFLAVLKKEMLEPFAGLAGSLLTGAESIEPGMSGLATLLAETDNHGKQDFLFASIDKKGVELGIVQARKLVAAHYQPLSEDAADNRVYTVLEGIGHITSKINLDQAASLIVCGFDVAEETIRTLSEKTEFSVKYVDFRETGMQSLSHAKAHGIALAGAKNRPPGVNLMPEGQRKKTGKVGSYLLILLSVLTLLVGVSLVGTVLVQKHLLSQQLDAELAGLNVSMNSLKKMVKDAETNEHKIGQINFLQGKTALISDVLLEISTIIPEDAWVERFSLSKDEFRIEGYAESASDILTLLESSKRVNNVMFLSAITRRYNKERFRIGFKID